MDINKLLKKLAESGVEINIIWRDGNLAYELGGFYKSGYATLYELDGSWFAETRYNTVTPVECIEDLKNLNDYWLLESEWRSLDWLLRTPEWQYLHDRLEEQTT